MESLNTHNTQPTKTGDRLPPLILPPRLEPGKTPYDEIRWETRTASIGNDKGVGDLRAARCRSAGGLVADRHQHRRQQVFLRQTGVAGARNQRGPTGASAWSNTIADWGKKDGYFKTAEDGENFRAELAHLMLTQKACFNSPVWFNVGVKETRGYGWIYDEQPGRVTKLESGVVRPQCSACFIVSVKDSLESILDLAKTEGMLFKWGSGTGIEPFGAARRRRRAFRRRARLRPLSFMKGFDAFAGVIKSGGKTRRAAKMVILNADHPDIEKFIWCKAKEEKKAYTLVEAGYDASLDGEAYSSIFFQNANNSVRATDDFMEAVARDGDWWTKGVFSGQPASATRRAT